MNITWSRVKRKILTISTKTIKIHRTPVGFPSSFKAKVDNSLFLCSYTNVETKVGQKWNTRHLQNASKHDTLYANEFNNQIKTQQSVTSFLYSDVHTYTGMCIWGHVYTFGYMLYVYMKFRRFWQKKENYKLILHMVLKMNHKMIIFRT